MVIKNFRHSMLNYYYLIGQLVVPLGSTFYFPPMLNYFNFGRIWLTGGAVRILINSHLYVSPLVVLGNLIFPFTNIGIGIGGHYFNRM